MYSATYVLGRYLDGAAAYSLGCTTSQEIKPVTNLVCQKHMQPHSLIINNKSSLRVHVSQASQVSSPPSIVGHSTTFLSQVRNRHKLIGRKKSREMPPIDNETKKRMSPLFVVSKLGTMVSGVAEKHTGGEMSFFFF